MLPKLKLSLPPKFSELLIKGSCNQNSIYSTFDCSKSVVVICLVIPAQLFEGFVKVF